MRRHRGPAVFVGVPSTAPTRSSASTAPATLRRCRLSAAAVAPALAPIKGHPMAKAAVETAVLGRRTARDGVSFAVHLGAVRDAVDSGVSVGIMDSIPAARRRRRVHRPGYMRIKLKIEPGWTSSRCAPCASASATACCSRWTPTPPTRWPTPVSWPNSTVRSLLIEQPLARTILRPRRVANSSRHGVPGRVDHLGPSASRRHPAGACAIVNTSPGAAAGTSRLAASTRVRGQPGAVWCGRNAESGLGSGRQRRPGRVAELPPSPATRRRRTAIRAEHH